MQKVHWQFVGVIWSIKEKSWEKCISLFHFILSSLVSVTTWQVNSQRQLWAFSAGKIFLLAYQNWPAAHILSSSTVSSTVKGRLCQAADSSIISSLHVFEFAEWKSDAETNQGGSSSASDFCLTSTKPVFFPWQLYQWQFGRRLLRTCQMTNQQHWFHQTSTERPYIPVFVCACFFCLSTRYGSAMHVKPEC